MSSAKKAKTEATYLMNINDAMDKQWEGSTITAIAQAPISALQGLAGWTDAEFAKLGLSSIAEFGSWKFFLWARALCKLSETELPEKREVASRMNLNFALDKAHEGKHLKEILKLPPSALQGLAEWVDKPLAALHINNIQQLGTWKFAEWASAISLLVPLEQELPPYVVPSPLVSEAPATVAAAPATAAAAPATVAAAPATPSAVPAAALEAKPDPEAVAVAGDEAVEVRAHFKLAHVDVELNMDKFFTMQTLTCGNKFLFAQRWGRTGTRGQAKVEGPLDHAEEAAALLSAKFKEKTGNAVESVENNTFQRIRGLYDLVKGDVVASRRTVEERTQGRNGGRLWQYYVDDGVDGKANGWYDYSKDAAEIVEGVHSEWVNNPEANYDVRCVQSGFFCYRVDFNAMQQTNVTHPNRTQRRIRRNA
eukprot:CAMPEP_0119326578 /NCGR_PEP_ID=MMETSP1333-20130426/68717_1 /TAXON_ID=418940 /ORGANISM="Scyphosphaera apsteinii, Strain RCC1455" /LENGTH=422 /DNA_ID=CAMNT_0007334917 /DNA_START=73 /DNA_END=1341 /DNA_ORIENTATION=+